MPFSFFHSHAIIAIPAESHWWLLEGLGADNTTNIRSGKDNDSSSVPTQIYELLWDSSFDYFPTSLMQPIHRSFVYISM